MLPFLWLPQAGCYKDYSYEGGDTLSTTRPVITRDSLPTQPINYNAACGLCKPTDALTLNTWNFKNNQDYFCGVTTDAGFIGTNTTFTFFGPSLCSLDTGLVMTVYLPLKFDEDKYNIKTNSVAFYYYDHRGATDMFIKQYPLNFSVTIQSYIRATGLTTGLFEGAVYKPNGDTTYIKDGKFKVLLK